MKQAGFPALIRQDPRRLPDGARSRCSFRAVALCFGLCFQASKGFLAIDRLHRSTFQIIIAAVEHIPRLDQLVEISRQCILQDLVSPTSALGGEIVELLFNVGGEVDFHGFRIQKGTR